MKRRKYKDIHVQERLTRKIVARASLRGAILVAIGAMLWAFSSACGQFLMERRNFPSEWIASTRILLAGTLLTLLALRRNAKAAKELFKSAKDLTELLLFGVFGMMLAQLTFLKTIDASNAATATVLQYTSPIFIIIYVCIRHLKLPRLTELISIFLAVTGVFLLATKGEFSLAIPPMALIYGLLSSLGMVFFSLIPRRIIPKYGSFLVTGLGMLAGGIVMLFIVRPWRYTVHFDLAAVLAYLGVAVGGSTVGYTLYMQGVADIGPVKASMIASIEPVASAVFAAFLGTRFVWWQDYVGMACIIATVFILMIPPRTTKVSFHPNKRIKKKTSEEQNEKQGNI